MGLILQKIDNEPIIPLDYLINHYLFKGVNGSKDYLLSLLNKAVEIIEDRSGLFLKKRVFKLIHNNCSINLFGPVNSIIEMKDRFNNDIKPLEFVRSSDNIFLRFSDDLEKVFIVYDVGYTINNLPVCLRESILNELFTLYEEFDSDNSYDKNLINKEDLYFYRSFNCG